MNAIIAADVPDFQNLDLDTIRKTYSGGFSYNFDPRWEIKVSASQTQQNGLKPLNMISLANGTFSAVLPNLIDQTTNQYNASLNYTGEQFFFTAAYYGSYFTNNNNSMTFDNAFAKGTLSTMSTAPEQRIQPVHAEGRLQLLADHEARDGRVVRPQHAERPVPDRRSDLLPLGLPTTSLNGLVETEMFSARLTAKPMKDLNSASATPTTTATTRRRSTPTSFYDAGEAEDGRFIVQLARSVYRAGNAGQQHQHLRQPAVQQEGEHVRSPTPNTSWRRASS